MRLHSTIGISLLISGACVTPAIAQGGAPRKLPAAISSVAHTAQEKAVLDLEHGLLDARVTTNTALHRSAFAQEGLYIHSSGWAQNRDDVLDMVANARWGSWTNSQEEVHLYGDLAVTHSLLVVSLTDKRTETVRTTGVYIKRLGKWNQVSWQSSAGKFVAS